MTVKIYKKELHSCYDCPMLRVLSGSDTKLNYCHLSGKLIEHSMLVIPEWCLLDDRKKAKR